MIHPSALPLDHDRARRVVRAFAATAPASESLDGELLQDIAEGLARSVSADQLPSGTGRRWVRLLGTRSYDAWVIGWPPGTGLDLHDHGESSAAVGVVFRLLLSPLTWQHHYLFFLLPGYAWTTRAWAEDRRLVAAVLAGLTGLVLLRLPGDWLLIRPVATLAAFLVWTFASARAARLGSVVDREPQ